MLNGYYTHCNYKMLIFSLILLKKVVFMHIKYLISNLLHLSKSASFVLVSVLCFTICNQVFAYQHDVTIQCLFDGPPTSATGGNSTGTGK